MRSHISELDTDPRCTNLLKMLVLTLMRSGSSPATPSDVVGMPHWIADPVSVPFLHAANFWFGAIGFGITLATFALGWRKLAKVEKAAKAASEAVQAMKLRVSRYDASVDASEALYRYREIGRHLDPLDWRAIVRSMSSVRRSTIRMDATLDGIDQGAVKELRRVSKALDKHIRVIEEALSGGSAFPADHVIRATVRSGEEALEKAKRLIEDKIS
jgi:hypothetical protein